jgi:hypothetical protein
MVLDLIQVGMGEQVLLEVMVQRAVIVQVLVALVGVIVMAVTGY